MRNIFPGEHALSSFDHRHQFVASGSYQLPFFEGVGGAIEALAGGWRVNAIITLQSGAPFTVNLGQDRANIGSGPAQRPDQIGDPNLAADQRSPDRWFNTAAFGLQAPFTFGSAGRNSVFAPGLATVDLSILNRWDVGAQGRLEFRWEVSQPAQSCQLRRAQPDLRHPELRSHLQRPERSRDTVRSAIQLLESDGASPRTPRGD